MNATAPPISDEVTLHGSLSYTLALVLLTVIYWSFRTRTPDDYVGSLICEPEEKLEASEDEGVASDATWIERLPRAINAKGRPCFSSLPPYGHMQGVMLPEQTFVVGNQPEPLRFENEYCWGLLLPMLRPTADTRYDRVGAWPFGDHFEGKKRLWEFRFECHLKKPLPGDVFFGIELDKYVPVSGAAKKIMAVTVGMLRKAVGKCYHSPGDDPATTKGELELPTFTMPLWAFDQFIETPVGSPAPSLVDRNFESLGVRRNADRKAFMERMQDVKMEPGPTYTFAFWGIAQFVDTVRWEIKNVMPWSIDFNTFCKAPPVRVVMYSLEDARDSETRHLNSRKRYLMNTVFWSSRKPPSPEKIKSFFPAAQEEEVEQKQKRAKKGLAWTATNSLGLLSCCMSRI